MPSPRSTLLSAGLLLVLLSGCGSSPHKAPVEERRPTQPVVRAPVTPPKPAPVAEPVAVVTPAPETPKPLPGVESAGKPGFYTVKPGDKLIRIALDNGQNWRDLARWNAIENPNVIEVGQVLRVVPPGVDPNAVATNAVAFPKPEPRPLAGKPTAAAPASSAVAAAAVVSVPAAQAPSAASMPVPPPASAPAREGDEDMAWAWPAAGSVFAGFEEGKHKGLSIAGKAGDAVLAAADGRVVYAGSGLRGYGNLVIVKHNTIYLTAYAHNQTLLVKEDQAVRRGQKIAEMGSSDADRVQLHFEIRRQGKPIDPARLLPAR